MLCVYVVAFINCDDFFYFYNIEETSVSCLQRFHYLPFGELVMNFSIRRYIKVAFDHADEDGEGSLTKHQYKVAMTVLFGYCPDKMEINYVYRSMPDKGISFKEFKYWVCQKCPTGQSRLSLETIFGLLDHDYKGYLTLSDLCTASKVANMRISLSVWLKAFKELDHYAKGYIDLTEFTYIFTSIKNNININYT